jgi:hypothetical protein
MAEGKLYITITDDRGDGGGTPTPKPDGAKEKKSNDDTIGRYIEHEMFHLVKSQATQFVNFSLGNIGNFTGDYITQRRVNETKQAISGLMNIGMTTIAGAKYGPYGAIAGFAIGVISQMTGSVYDVISSTVENSKTNYELAQLRELSGLNSTKDGSRGTEN